MALSAWSVILVFVCTYAICEVLFGNLRADAPSRGAFSTVYIPTPGSKLPPASVTVEYLLRGHALISRGGKLQPYSHFIDSVSDKARQDVQSRLLIAAALEMGENGFGKVPLDSDPALVYLVFPARDDANAVDKKAHAVTVDLYIKESGHTLKELLAML